MLTSSQLTALKAAIIADNALNSQPNNSDGAFAIAAALNLPASPTWVVWRTAVTRQEILQNGFDWTRLDNLSVGKARVWSDIFVDGLINPSKPNASATRPARKRFSRRARAVMPRPRRWARTSATIFNCLMPTLKRRGNSHR